MSILKGIMHHWNKTKNDYDVIHPETDYKKITDWNEGIVATLASTALGTLVSTLTSDSLLATMIQKVLTATGVKYNIAQNGYLCFGSLFGGLIIQWGLSKSRTAVTCPIAFTAAHISIGTHIGTDSSVNIIIDTNAQSNTSMTFLDNYSSSVYVEWIAIGY